MLHVQHERNLLVGVVVCQTANEFVDLAARDEALTADVVQRTREFRRSTTRPADRNVGDRVFTIDEHYHFADEATQQVLPIAIACCRCVPHGFQVRTRSAQPLRIFVAKWSWTPPP